MSRGRDRRCARIGGGHGAEGAGRDLAELSDGSRFGKGRLPGCLLDERAVVVEAVKMVRMASRGSGLRRELRPRRP